MKNKMQAYQWVLLIDAVVFTCVGVFALCYPVQLVSAIGIVLQTPAAITDVRATYGGSEIGLAIFFALAYRSNSRNAAGYALLAAALTITGFALSRVLGLFLDGHEAMATWALLALETLGAVMNWMAFLNLSKRDRL